jgi:hypothetical protein
VPEALRSLARDVRRLNPHRHDPERFYTDKEAVSERLTDLARRVERGEP